MSFKLAVFNLGTPQDLGLPTTSIDSAAKSIFSTVFIVIGALAVAYLVLFGAIPYIMSSGEPSGIKKAKEAIVYAMIGLVVSLLGFAIVGFVTSKVR